jgi:hypothetical protein
MEKNKRISGFPASRATPQLFMNQHSQPGTVKIFTILFVLVASGLQLSAQINSPYSRFGLGDKVVSQNIVNRGMGGITAGYSNFMSVNFNNPASYSDIKYTVFDIGVEYASHTLRGLNDPQKYNSKNLILNYLQLGIPLKFKKDWGMVIGLRPISNIDYRIQRNGRLGAVDSTITLFEGSGGSYQAYLGTGYGFKNLSVGVNVGYFFGRKEFSSKQILFNDTVAYHKGNYVTNTNFGNVFVNLGLQYSAKLKKDTWLRLGAYGNLQQKLRGSRDYRVETFEYDFNGGEFSVDSVYEKNGQSGEVIYPATFGTGLLFEKEAKWMMGLDFSTTNWSNFRFFGAKDSVANSWELRLGGQYVPSVDKPKSYWSRVMYRAGFYYGTDYLRVGGKTSSIYGFSFGAGFPMRRTQYSNQTTVINTSFEFGRRGNNTTALRENYFKLGVGLSLSDLWFIKPKYQ